MFGKFVKVYQLAVPPAGVTVMLAEPVPGLQLVGCVTETERLGKFCDTLMSILVLQDGDRALAIKT